MQLDLFAEPDGSCGRTYQAHSPAPAAQTLLSWLERWQVLPSSPQNSGAKKAPVWVQTGSSNGACLTLNGSDWRNGASACSLSSILETGPVDRRFYLSPKACAGILRRAEKRGKALPPALSEALMAVATSTTQEPHT